MNSPPPPSLTDSISSSISGHGAIRWLQHSPVLLETVLGLEGPYLGPSGGSGRAWRTADPLRGPRVHPLDCGSTRVNFHLPLIHL